MRPSGSNVTTKIYRNLPKFLPLALSQSQGSTQQSMDPMDQKDVWVHEKNWNTGLLRIEACGAITASTIFSLIAVVATIQCADPDVSIIIEDSTVTVKSVNAKRWMEKYLGHRNYREVSKDLRRLITYKIFWIDIKGDFTTQSYVYDGSLKNNQLEIILNRKFVDLCVSKGLEVEYMAIQRKLKKKPVAKLLYLYLCSNSGLVFKEDTIFSRIGLKRDDGNNRRTIKKAFTDLEKAEFIVDWKYDDQLRKFKYS